MKTMTEKNEKILKIIHITSMSIWFTSLIIMFVINLLISKITSSDVFYYAHYINSIIDFQILTPAAIVTFVTGIIYGRFTKWNIKNNTWLKIKIVITVSIIILGTFWLGPTLREMTENSKSIGVDLLSDKNYLSNLSTIIWFSAINILMLFIAIIISTIKPGSSNND